MKGHKGQKIDYSQITTFLDSLVNEGWVPKRLQKALASCSNWEFPGRINRSSKAQIRAALTIIRSNLEIIFDTSYVKGL